MWGRVRISRRRSTSRTRITIINMEMCTMYPLRLAESRRRCCCGYRASHAPEGETHPDEHKDEYRDKVVCSRDRVLVGQTEEVHDGGAHAQYALDFVARRLVRVDGLDLGLSGRPGGFLQVDLQEDTCSSISGGGGGEGGGEEKEEEKRRRRRYLWDLERSVVCCHYFGEPLDVFVKKPARDGTSL